MFASKVIRASAAVLAATCFATLAACSGSLGSGSTPTSTGPPLPAAEMCTRGKNVFAEINDLDNKKPEYLDQVKKTIKPLADRAPQAIVEDMKAWVAYVQSVTDASQLASLPADMRVSTNRIDQWWQQNCGNPLIGA